MMCSQPVCERGTLLKTYQAVLKLSFWPVGTGEKVTIATRFCYERQSQYVAWSAPSHYLDQCWNIVNSNKLQWNIKRNSHIFIQKNAFENVVCDNIVKTLIC